MKCFGLCLVLFSLVLSTNGLFGFNWTPSWETLRVTFGINLFSKWTFAKMPLNRIDAANAGFQLIPSSSNCTGLFQGYRYVKDNDSAVILLYDVNGYIAGIQTSFAENNIKTSIAMAWFKQQPMFTVEHLPLNETDNFYTLTAYLVDPSIICTTGRTPQQFNDAPGGIDLYLKNGTENRLIPKKQSDIGQTKWTLGKCFVSMGVHYWYDTSKDLNCNYFQPFFLMYNKNVLTGFGFAVVGFFDSHRYEHPDKPVFSKFFKVIPDCLNQVADEIGPLTTMHVYMNAKPLNLMC